MKLEVPVLLCSVSVLVDLLFSNQDAWSELTVAAKIEKSKFAKLNVFTWSNLIQNMFYQSHVYFVIC